MAHPRPRNPRDRHPRPRRARTPRRLPERTAAWRTRPHRPAATDRPTPARHEPGGSTAERGYTGEHVKLRRQWKPAVDAGQAHCTEPVCLYRTRWIPPGTAWDLAHDRVDGGYRGPAHRLVIGLRAPAGATRHAGAAGTGHRSHRHASRGTGERASSDRHTAMTPQSPSRTHTPRWASPRSRRRTSGPAVAAVAKQLGLDLLPWQRQVLCVGVGADPGPSCVPRRARQRAAAVRQVVARAVADGVADAVRAGHADLVQRADPFRGAGEDCCRPGGRGCRARRWPIGSGCSEGSAPRRSRCDNGSHAAVAVATEGSRARRDHRPGDRRRGVGTPGRPGRAEPCGRRWRPGPHAQLWAMSTAGTSKSVWWRGKLDAGRAAAEMGVADGLACFDWSAPDDCNPADEAVWWQTMPALGRLIDVETVRADMAEHGPGRVRPGVPEHVARPGRRGLEADPARRLGAGAR